MGDIIEDAVRIGFIAGRQETAQHFLILIEDHAPYLSDDDEDSIENSVALMAGGVYGIERDAADLAIRTCRCGVPIDGFDEYVSHLKAMVTARWLAS